MTCRVRSSHPGVFYKNSVLKNFAKLTENICAGVFFNKDLGWRPATLSKKYSSTVFFV